MAKILMIRQALGRASLRIPKDQLQRKKETVDQIYAQIEDELRTQYVASYTPTNTKLDGSYRKLDIECKGDGLKVQSRKGYYAVAPSE